MKTKPVQMPPPDLKLRRSLTMTESRHFLSDKKDRHAFVAVSDSYLDISDCNRRIQLDFAVWGDDQKELDAEFAERLEKIQRLANALRYIEDNLHVAYARNSKRIQEKK